jgi:hypothetical protein
MSNLKAAAAIKKYSVSVEVALSRHFDSQAFQ